MEQGCNVIVDIHKKRMEVYSLKPQNRETDKFVALFEEKAQAYLDQRICPQCHAALPKNVAFCPFCGAKL